MPINKRCWCTREQIKPGATSTDLMCIEESEENEAEDQHFVEAHIVQKDAWEENVFTKEKQLPTIV